MYPSHRFHALQSRNERSENPKVSGRCQQSYAQLESDNWWAEHGSGRSAFPVVIDKSFLRRLAALALNCALLGSEELTKMFDD